ncbi:MAG: hypothetical protein ACW98X_19025 [Promethearchaeota archaeon]
MKVLSRPNEKPILSVDILVTKSTDLGWTMLLIKELFKNTPPSFISHLDLS